MAALSVLVLAACSDGDGIETTPTSEPVGTTRTSASVTTITSTTLATTTTSPTTTTSDAEADLGPLYTISFSAEATGVVEVEASTGGIVREVTGAIGEGSDSLDYVRAKDSLVYSRVVTAAMSEVVEVPASGGEPELLAIGSAVDAAEDGSVLAVARRELVDGGPNRMVLEVQDFEGNIVNSWSDDSPAEDAPRVCNLAWGPDGRMLAIEIRFEDRTEVFLLDTASESGSIQEVATVVERTEGVDRAMRSAPFWLDQGRLGVVEACCGLPSFDTWEAIVVDPVTGERQSSLFRVDRGISEVDVHAEGEEIAFIQSHDVFGSVDDVSPDQLKVWIPDRGISGITDEHQSVGW